jgi:hypothetical protein
VEILCREQRDDEVEQEVTQRDQFNTDEVTLLATLIREPHQNSLDAKPTGSSEAVRTCIRVIEPEESNRKYFEDLFSGLVPHLEKSDIDLTGIDIGMPRILLIEDFNTTGLTGDFRNKKEKNPFNNFWRRIGSSSKGGTAGGRWGLGKLVFSSASRIQTFFGLTVRYNEDPRVAYLMGQAVLANREVDGKQFAPHVFFAEQGENGLQLPVSDLDTVKNFRKAFGVSRIDEPGLSVAIPFALSQLTAKALVPEVLQNYFFPILTGKLVVDVANEVISEATFDEVSSRYGWGHAETNGNLVSFVREIYAAKGPDLVMKSNWAEKIDEAIGENGLDKLRTALSTDGKLIHVRAPITLKRKNGENRETYFDLFLKKTPDGSQGRSLYVRSSITVPDEARYFSPRQTFGALIATDEAITTFLGDAENPAHTRWNGQADKLKQWKAADVRLKEIRGSLSKLQNALMHSVETIEPEALKDLFSIKDIVEKKNNKPLPTSFPPKSPVPSIPTILKWYRIEKTSTGFSLRSDIGLVDENLPLQIEVSAAYDVIRGNPFKKFSPFDFDFNKTAIKIETVGAECEVTGANALTITIGEIPFSVEVEGFDSRRDLMVKATR